MLVFPGSTRTRVLLVHVEGRLLRKARLFADNVWARCLSAESSSHLEVPWPFPAMTTWIPQRQEWKDGAMVNLSRCKRGMNAMKLSLLPAALLSLTHSNDPTT
jgi:hypothetical protein